MEKIKKPRKPVKSNVGKRIHTQRLYNMSMATLIKIVDNLIKHYPTLAHKDFTFMGSYLRYEVDPHPERTKKAMETYTQKYNEWVNWHDENRERLALEKKEAARLRKVAKIEKLEDQIDKLKTQLKNT